MKSWLVALRVNATFGGPEVSREVSLPPPKLKQLKPWFKVPSIVRAKSSDLSDAYKETFECVELISPYNKQNHNFILVFHGPSGIGKSYLGNEFKNTYKVNVFETDSMAAFNDKDKLYNYLIDNNIQIIVVGNRPGSEKLDSILSLECHVDFLSVEFTKLN